MMGTLQSQVDHSLMMTVNGVLLAEPVILPGSPALYIWDDDRLPNGRIVDGSVVVDEGL
jgi:hypothetical protein